MDKKTIQEIGLPETPLSYWMASTPLTDYPSLNDDTEVDVAIVGGGLVGITSAFLLKKEGYRVAVIEADRIVQGTTGHTTAKITSQHVLIYNYIKIQMGMEKAQQYADANQSAIDMIESIVKEKNIDCDFERQSAYVYTQQDKYIQQIADETITASSLGIKATYLEEVPLPVKIKAAMRFDNQAQFHPRKYVLSLAKDIPGGGSYIFEHTRAVDIQESSEYMVITNNGKKVTAKYIIAASHFPFHDGTGLYFTRLYPERSYALGATVKEKYPGGMYITAEDPGRSVRYQKYDGKELLIFSGEHHKTGHGPNTIEHYENLAGFARQIFEVKDILYRWSTQDFSTPDSVPYVGRHSAGKPNLFVATGFRKWGMTNSTASAMIIRDLIVKGESPWEPVYSPSRFIPSTSAANTFIKQNVHVAKEFITEKLKPIPEDVEIMQGEAKVVEVDGQRVGAYRDEKGKLHMVDTTCTHMGCELMWNYAEKSWDCPCHGSRFTYEGEVIEGPTKKPLRKYEE